MARVPCSIAGCQAEGVRWAIYTARPWQATFPFPSRMTIETARFVCDEHAKGLDSKRWILTPPLENPPNETT